MGSLKRVLRHSNTEADDLPNQGANFHLFGPKLFLGVLESHLRKEIYQWKVKEKQNTKLSKFLNFAIAEKDENFNAGWDQSDESGFV